MRRALTLLLGALAAGLPACTPEQYAQQADRVAHATLGAGQKAALGGQRPFDIEYRPFAADGQDEDARGIRINGKVLSTAGPPTVLTPEDCLEIAFRNSRRFQTRKEQLYSSALALANVRRTWDWSLITGDIDAEYFKSRTPGVGGDELGAAGANLTLTQRFIHGGVLALGASLDVATDFLGSSSTTVDSLLEANFTQPLLRGAWRELAYEDQYRLERDFLFAVYDYERFTQTFAADIVTSYYSVLQRRDQLANEEENIKRLKDTLTLTRVLSEQGQVPPIQANQAEQDFLVAQVRREGIVQAYEDALDSFKITLGLPIEISVELDYPGELESLRKAGPKPVGFDQGQAITTALVARPDVLFERANLRDAGRDVEIAADDFNPSLDLEVGIGAEGSEDREFWRTRFHEHTRFVDVAFNYPIDQTDNRDAYRRALIAWAKAERDFEEFLDEVRLEVRQSYRTLVRSRRSYEIQVRNVEVAEVRRKLAVRLQKDGEASARDVLEAEDALRTAQNGLTSALVSYTTTRLEFLAGLGMLWVDEKGQINERAEPFKFTLLRERYE